MNETKKPIRYAYCYDKANKTELFCTVTQSKNASTAETAAEIVARKILPKDFGKFLILKTENEPPLGSFLSDTLSLNFSEIMLYVVDDDSLELRPDFLARIKYDISPLIKWGGAKTTADVWTFIRRLYSIRKYIDMCIEHPRFYSFGMFQRLLESIAMPEWHLQTLGFFVPAETEDKERFFFNDVDRALDDNKKDREELSAKFNRTRSYLNLLPQLDEILKAELLMFGGGNLLPLPHLEFFEISNVVDAVLLSLFHLLQERTVIKKCANCNKLFVPLARADAIYCDRPAPQDSKKTCKEYGSKVLWYENVVSDDVAKLARNIYCSKQMLAKRNPDKPEYAEMFEYFKGEKKKWEQQVKAGAKTREEFAEWLRAVKLCKTLGELERS